jgi:hypothetical protein
VEPRYTANLLLALTESLATKLAEVSSTRYWSLLAEDPPEDADLLLARESTLSLL